MRAASRAHSTRVTVPCSFVGPDIAQASPRGASCWGGELVAYPPSWLEGHVWGDFIFTQQLKVHTRL